MTWRPALIAGAVACIVWIGAIVALMGRDGGSGTDVPGGAAIRLPIDPASVDAIVIERGQGSAGPVTVVRDRRLPGSAWTVEAADGSVWPADDDAVRAAIRALAGVRLDRRTGGIGAEVADAAWALTVRSGDSSVTLRAAQGTLAGRVPVELAGDGVGSGESALAWLSEASLAAMALGDLGSLAAEGASARVPWASGRPFGSSDDGSVVAVELAAPGASGGMLRLERRAGVWGMAEPGIELRLDQSAVSGLVATIRSLMIADVKPAEPGALPRVSDSASFQISLFELVPGVNGPARRIARRLVIDTGSGSVTGAAGAVATITREPADDDAGDVALAAAGGTIDPGLVSGLSVDPRSYADARVLPWPAEETRSVAIGDETFVRGLDGWRREAGAPLSPGESRAVDAALAVLARGESPPALGGDQLDGTAAVPMVLRRLGLGDEVTAEVVVLDGALIVRDGAALWAWGLDATALGWLRERFDAAVAAP